jgi:hypothetical protein
MLDATFLVWQHLAGITKRIGVKDLLNQPLISQVLSREHQPHHPDLLNSNSMFPRETSAQLNTLSHDLFTGSNDSVNLCLIAVIEVKTWVQVAVPGMKHVRHSDPKLRGYGVNEVQHFREL